MENHKKNVIKKATIISILLLLIIAVGFVMIKYEIEGEKNMPFKLSKIMIISTADGITKDEKTITVNQCNDFYLSIEKDVNNSRENMIKNVYIENIKVLSEPQKGTVEFYRPSLNGKLVFDSSEECKINDSITYAGDIETNLHTLTISNQGGTICFRSCVQNAGKLEIEQNATSKAISYNNDGRLLEKAEISTSEIKYNIGFDVIIELADGKMYKGYVNETLPIEDTQKGGVRGIEKADLEKVVFKRIKIK